MKGTIIKCMQELVEAKFGQAKWKESLKGAGMKETTFISTSADYSDSDVLNIMKGISHATGLTADQVTEAFGDYWSTVYAPDVYRVYFEKAKSAKELLLNLDTIHTMMTQSMKGAHPPHFKYEQQGEKVLVMHYHSARGLVSLMPALIRGIGKHYHEKLDVTTNGETLRVQFS